VGFVCGYSGGAVRSLKDFQLRVPKAAEALGKYFDRRFIPFVHQIVS
jgi:hypothetical protein